MATNDLLSLWRRAAKAKYGIAISTDDRTLLRQQLYRVRAEAGDEALQEIAMMMSRDGKEVWLVRKGADVSSRG